MMKNIFLQFTELYNMASTCVNIVKQRISCLLCLKTKTPSCIPKNKLKLCICVWTSMTWFGALESTLPFKTASDNSWETAWLSKILCDNAPLAVQQFASPKFPAAWSFLNLLEAPSLFGEYFFSYDFKKIEYFITLVNSNAASREPLIIFVALMVSLST